MSDITTQKREPKRSAVFLRGRLQGKDNAQDVRVRDVSVDGALVEAANPPSIDETVILTCGETCTTGRVAWAKDSRIGIEFAQDLSKDTLFDSLNQEMKVSAPRLYSEGRILGSSD